MALPAGNARRNIHSKAYAAHVVPQAMLLLYRQSTRQRHDMRVLRPKTGPRQLESHALAGAPEVGISGGDVLAALPGHQWQRD